VPSPFVHGGSLLLLGFRLERRSAWFNEHGAADATSIPARNTKPRKAGHEWGDTADRPVCFAAYNIRGHYLLLPHGNERDRRNEVVR